MDDVNSERIQEVLSTELRWARAHLELDFETLEHILSDDYRQIQADGSFIRKNPLLTSYRSGVRSWEIAESFDHDIRIFGEVAIVYGLWRGKGMNAGERFHYSARFIAVYMLEAGQWKLHLEQSIPSELGRTSQVKAGQEGNRRDVRMDLG